MLAPVLASSSGWLQTSSSSSHSSSAQLLFTDPEASQPSSSIAVLVVGLVRGTSSGNHLQELATFLDSFPGGRADVFSVLELSPLTETETGNCSSASVESRLREHMRPTVLQLLDADKRAEQARAMGKNVALYQFWKTSLAMYRLNEHEKGARRGVPYKYVVRVRIDSSFRDVNSSEWFPPLVDAMARGRTFAAQDFAWAARRDQAGLIGHAARGVNDERPERYMSLPDLAWARVNASEWAWNCSMFAHAVPWPKSFRPDQGRDAVRGRLARWLKIASVPTRAALLADNEDEQGAVPADSTLHGEAGAAGGFLNPQFQLGLAFFSRSSPQPPSGAESGPACFPTGPHQPLGPTRLLEDFDHDERKRLPC